MIELVKSVRKHVSASGSTGSVNKRNPSSVEKFLTNEHSYDMMLQYSQSEFSAENVFAWSALYPLKLKDVLTIGDVCDIYEQFVRVGCQMEVNVPSVTRSKLKDLVQQYSELEKSEVTIMFDEALKSVYSEVIGNLSDTYARLSTTVEFRNMMEVIEMQETILLEEYKTSTDILTEYNLFQATND